MGVAHHLAQGFVEMFSGLSRRSLHHADDGHGISVGHMRRMREVLLDRFSDELSQTFIEAPGGQMVIVARDTPDGLRSPARSGGSIGGKKPCPRFHHIPLTLRTPGLEHWGFPLPLSESKGG